MFFIVCLILIILTACFNRPQRCAVANRFRAVAIGLPHRKQSHFCPLSKQLLREGMSVQFFQGINGKTVDIERVRMSARYRHFLNTPIADQRGRVRDYRGHLGCTLSHLAVLKSIQIPNTVILEDDACPVSGLGNLLEQLLATSTKIEPRWEILMLGFSCNYKDHPFNRLNDCEPVYTGGLVRLHFWIGQWAYVVRDAQTAQKICALLDPIPWHIDIALANLARSGVIKVLGAVPPVITHPGVLRLSSFDMDQSGNPNRIKSDTNGHF